MPVFLLILFALVNILIYLYCLLKTVVRSDILITNNAKHSPCG